jgi:hypothetical protein
MALFAHFYEGILWFNGQHDRREIMVYRHMLELGDLLCNLRCTGGQWQGGHTRLKFHFPIKRLKVSC